MRFVITFLLLGFCLDLFAQDAEFVDQRTKKESFLRVYDKDQRGDLACFTLGGIEESMGKGKLKRVPLTNFGPDFIRFDSNNIQVTIRSGIFFSTKHKMGIQGGHVTKIDNRPYFGNYGKVPTTNIASVTVVIDKDTVVIPPAAYADLYNPQFVYRDAGGVNRTQDAVYLSEDKRKIYIYMLNKDDTGSYEVTWIIQEKAYNRRVIDYGFTK